MYAGFNVRLSVRPDSVATHIAACRRVGDRHHRWVVEHLSGVFWDSLGCWDPRIAESPTDAPAADAHVSKVRSVGRMLQRAGVWVTPTLQCLENHAWFTPAHDQVMRQVVTALQEAGAGMLLAGDDGFDVHDELAALVRAGLSPYQALVTGTRNPARFFGMLDSSGAVAVGKRADLVLLYGNPLADIRHTREPAGVMLAGRWLGRDELDRRLLVSVHDWLGDEVTYNAALTGATSEGRKKIRESNRKLMALADSFVSSSRPAEQERVGRRIAEELGAVRAMLTADQQVAFDVQARVWLREQLRQGRTVSIPGLAMVP
jgi:hypothetical protein